MPGEPTMCLVNFSDNLNLKATPVVKNIWTWFGITTSIHWVASGKLLNLIEPWVPLLSPLGTKSHTSQSCDSVIYIKLKRDVYKYIICIYLYIVYIYYLYIQIYIKLNEILYAKCLQQCLTPN